MALVTAAQIRTLVPQLTGTAEDAIINTLSAQAEQALAIWCGFPREDSGTYSLTTSTYTEYLDGPDPRQSREIVLTVRPVVAITSIHQDSTEGYAASTVVDSADYTLFAERGRVMAKQSAGLVWLAGYRWIKVVYTAGYGTSGNAPDWVQQAVGWQVQRILEHTSRRGMSTVTAAGVSRSDAATIGSAAGWRPIAAMGIDPRAADILAHARLMQRMLA